MARVKRFDPDMFLYITRRVIAKDGRTTKWLYDLEKYGAVYRQFLQGLIDTEEIDRQKVEVVDAPDMAADEYYADYEGTDNKYYNDNCDQMFEEVEATYFDKVVEPEFKKHEHYYYEFVSTPPYSLFNSAWRELFDLKPGNNLLAPSVKW